MRLELALLGHLFTVAVKEWGLGLAYNPVLNVRRPSPGAGRNRRLSTDEEKQLLAAVDALWRHHPDLAEDAANDTVLEILTTP